MDEYLSEKEQIERIKEWWNDNGWYLVGGAVLGGLGLFGWGQYQDYSTNRALEAADLYQSMIVAVQDDDLAGIDTLLTQLREDYAGTPYADQAGLLAARHALIRDSERAARELRLVMNTSDDEYLAMVARLRLARILAYREQYDAALEVLDVSEPGQFAARLKDIEGDIHLSQGDTDAARAAFAEALAASGSDYVDRMYVQMKLNDLFGRAAEGPSDPEAQPLDPPPSGGEPAEAQPAGEPSIEEEEDG